MATSVNIDEKLKSRVQRLARSRDRTAHWIMCEAIRDYVDREEKHEASIREAKKSWQAYQETGEHLTLDEAEFWLETWGTDIETKVPDCHR